MVEPMDRLETYFLTADGRRIDYQSIRSFIPQGTMSIPLAAWHLVLPGAGTMRFGANVLSEPEPNVYRWEAPVTFERMVQDERGVWRIDPTSAVTVTRIAVSDYR